MLLAAAALAAPATQPIVSQDVVFEEVGGLIAVEAEHFFKQEFTDVRAWHLTTAESAPAVEPDGDPPHVWSASGNAYLEVLPDTRRTHGDKLIKGENFSDLPTDMAVLSYKTYFNTPGRYYVWARVFCTGTEDNGLHVGIDGEWPEHGKRMQWTARGKWFWDSKQRTNEVHTGVPGEIWIDVEKAGPHTIQFAMREDGIEFDKWLMTTDANFARPEDEGPAPKLKSGSLPAPFPPAPEPPAADEAAAPAASGPVPAIEGAVEMKAVDFPIEGTNFYVNRQWLAINPNEFKDAETKMAFPHESGEYRILFCSVGESDGSSSYRLKIGGRDAGECQSPISAEMYEEGVRYMIDLGVHSVNKGDEIAVRAAVGTKDGAEFSRGRWAKIIFAPPSAAIPAAPAADAPAEPPKPSPALNRKVEFPPPGRRRSRASKAN